MISTDDNYNNKLNNIIKNINNEYDNQNTKNIKEKISNKTEKKNQISKQYDSLNYSLEMHKVRKNKKADFDIYSTNNLDIEDVDIDKCIFYKSWKELSSEEQNLFIKQYANILYDKYNKYLNIDYIITFINNNSNKIKYDKINKCILNILDLEFKIDNENNGELYIKKMSNNISSQIKKLRKSLKKK